MPDLSAFAKSIKIRAKTIANNADNLVVQVVLAIDQAVVLATPVRTGRARANWRASLGEMNNDTLPAPVSPNQAIPQATAEAERVAKEYRKGDRKQVVHLTNSLPYIQKLNEGSSQQAPKDFVSIATNLALKAVKNVRIVE